MRAEARTARALAARHRIVTCGIGAERARRAANGLIEAGASGLLVWGTAGALIDGLAPGTLIIPREAIDTDRESHAAAPEWHGALLQKAPPGVAIDAGPLTSIARPVSGREAKTALHAVTGAVAADMETGSVAALASERGVSFAAVRAVVDAAGMGLPPVVRRARSERFLPLEVALRLAARPQDFPALIRLSRAMQAARQSLAAFARRLAETGLDERLY